MKTTDVGCSFTDVDPSSNSAPVAAFHSPKILSIHLERLAVVYVRQSSPHQVREHHESRARQYALADHARYLGWPKDRILILDEDQGMSGKSAKGRVGFQRLLSEVTMDHVGLVLALEVSRLARSSKDWHQLFELCGIVRTLLADQEGIYDANDPNDRLVLGLKGIMSEMELQTMRNRLDRGKLNKAQRGELFCAVPWGYVILQNGEVAKDPDEQVRSIVQLLFDKFNELGSARRLLLWLTAHGIRLPRRVRSGSQKGEIRWQAPEYTAVNRTLHHPIYAGAYAYGRQQPCGRSKSLGVRRSSPTLSSTDEWTVLIRDCLPAYITWDEFQRNRQRLTQNQSRPDTTGTPRQGMALLPGLVICGHCGWRMTVGYHGPDKVHYRCQRTVSLGVPTPCRSLTGNALDAVVARQVLKALEPASIELSIRAQDDLHRDRERLDRHWQQNLKRARYEADLAERRYRAVDPENRLVASTLEEQWEQALRQERLMQEEYDRAKRESCTEPSPDEIAQIVALSSEIPAIWNSPDTTHADRQSIIRCLIERVVVHVKPDSEYTDVVIRWMGGFESHLEFRRPVRRYEQMRDVDQLENRILELWDAGQSARQTADILNKEGFHPTNPDQVFTRATVQALRNRLTHRNLANGTSRLAPHEWNLRDLARHLSMNWRTLRAWAQKGWLHSRRSSAPKQWIVWADKEEMKRLQKLLACQAQGKWGYPTELTTPKIR